MNFDRGKFLKLSQELDTIHKREEQIVAEIQKLVAPATAPKPATTAKPKPKATAQRKGKKGELQKLVIEALKGHKNPQDLATVHGKVNKQRPGTTTASVSTVLHLLATKGKISRPAPGKFYLPPDDAAQQPQTASSATPTILTAPLATVAGVDDQGDPLER